MRFSIVYTIDTPGQVDLDRFSPPWSEGDSPREVESESLSAPRHLEVEGGWPDGKYRRWEAMLSKTEFNEFVRALGLRLDGSHTTGQYGTPGFVGWSPAVAFRSELPEAKLLALVTPCPDVDEDYPFFINDFKDVYQMALDHLDADLRPE